MDDPRELHVQARVPEGIRIEHLPTDQIEAVKPLWGELLQQIIDLNSVVPIRSLDESWPKRKKKYLEYLEQPDSMLLVARRAEEIVGYAMVHGDEWGEVWATGPRELEIESLCVTMAERGRGIGSAMLETIERELKNMGIDDVIIGVDSVNEGARRLYESRGYRIGFHLMHKRLDDDAHEAIEAIEE